jgi:hypothetical protein
LKVTSTGIVRRVVPSAAAITVDGVTVVLGTPPPSRANVPSPAPVAS